MEQTPTSKKYVLPKFYTCKGNLNERWFIQWKAENNQTGELETKRYTCPAKYETKKQREIWAKEWIIKITRMLESGYGFGAPKAKPDDPKVYFLIPELKATLETIRVTIRPKSYTTYFSAVNKLSDYIKIKCDPDDYRIDSFLSADAFLFRDHLINQVGNASRTANNTLIHLNTTYEHMKARIKVPDSPFVIKKLKQPDTTKNIAFTALDQARIEEYLKEHDPALYLFTRFIYFGFIRPGELNHMKVGDIYLSEGKPSYMLVRGEVSKTGRTETVEMIPPLEKLVKGMEIENSKQFCFLFGSGLRINRAESGKQVAFRRHEKIVDSLNFADDYTLYSWKHTGVVRAYESGVGIKELQKMLRHTSIGTTEIYLKSLGLRTDPNLKSYSW